MPQVTSQDEALHIAKTLLSQMEAEGSVPLSLVENLTRSLNDGWVFFYNSAEFLQTRNNLSRLAGNGPIFVRKSGEVNKLPTHQPAEVSIAALRFKSSEESKARLNMLSVGLNSERFAALLLYRRNTVLHPVAATVNCLLGCVLSGYIEPMPALISRCRAALGELDKRNNALRDEYVSVVESYLTAVEFELENARTAPLSMVHKS
jgi:hypothetical protein